MERTLKVFDRGDGAHCGLSDWYPNKEAALKRALKRKKPFSTGWYGSKKEIASARISSPDGIELNVEVSVSDDFDTPGLGSADALEWSLDGVRDAVSKAWDEAGSNQNENRDYRGYSVLHWTRKVPDWLRSKNVYPRERRKLYPKAQSQCVETYIVNCSEFYSDRPPGDNYHQWGWQDEGGKLKMTKATREKLEVFAQSLKIGSLRVGNWEIRSWDKEDKTDE